MTWWFRMTIVVQNDIFVVQNDTQNISVWFRMTLVVQNDMIWWFRMTCKISIYIIVLLGPTFSTIIN